MIELSDGSIVPDMCCLCKYLPINCASKEVESPSTDVQQLKAEIADFLDREICSDVAMALRLADGVLKLVRQHATI